MKKRSISLLLCLVLILSSSSVGIAANAETADNNIGYSAGLINQAANDAKLTADKEKYVKGDTAVVTVTDGTLADSLKVWIYGSDSKNAVISQEVTGDGAQTVDISALKVGTYVVGIFKDGECVGSTVVKILTESGFELKLAKTEYEVGANIYFNALNCADAEWVGIFHIENYESSNFQPWVYVDGMDVGNRINSTHGEEYFPSGLTWQYKYEKPPFPPGEYIAVLYHGENDYWYNEQDSVRFSIVAPSKAFELSNTEYSRGDTIEFGFKPYSTVDTVEMWTDGDEDNVAFSQSVTCNDTVRIETAGIADGEYVIGAFCNGELINSTGVYISYNDMSNNGTVINIFDDSYFLDLSEQTHAEQDGKIFIGWVDSEGNAVKSGYFAAGSVLTAKYADFSSGKNGDYYIEGVQIKNTGEQEIRYTFRKSAAFTALIPKVIEDAAIVIAPEVLNDNKWAELEYGRSYIYNGTAYTPEVLSGSVKNLTDGSAEYTVSVAVAKDQYTKNYTVRGIIRYYDLNGCEQLVYSEPYQTSVYNIADYTLKNSRGDISSAARANLESIVNTAKTNVKAKYDTQEKITVTGSPDHPGTYIYKLADSGLMVREMVVDSGLGGDPVEIVQLSDTHINYMNARDFEEANPTLLSTYKNRTWLKDASSVPTMRKVLDYASRADQIVVTGDVIDYLSRGAIDVMWKEIWNFFPGTLCANGNHDTYQKLGTVGDIYDYNYRYNWISSEWKNNFDYTSTVIKNKAMVIQLNNGQSRFEASQIKPLTKDLAYAREKGYPVFVFCHIPIYTNNPNEADVDWLRFDDWGNGNTPRHMDFCNNINNPGGLIVGRPSDKGTGSATEQVYNLITNNGDIIKGVFNGHMHNDYYTEIMAKTASGEDTVIPQYTMTASIYEDGRAIKITVK